MKNKALKIFIPIVIAIMLCFFVFNFLFFPNKYENFVSKYCREFKLETSLVYAIIKTESNFDKNAVSLSNARGLMQLLPSTASWISSVFGDAFSDDILFDQQTNIKYGCFYLRYLFDKFNDEDKVICAYNAGENKIKLWLNDDGDLDKNKINIDETKKYLEKVVTYKKIYESKMLFI